jgi:hypothetical protein
VTSTDGRLWTLSAILKAAVAAIDELEAEHPLLERLVRVFGMMPAEDREPIMGVLEREVALRLEHRHGNAPDDAPDTLRPNPGATLYLRVFDGPTAPLPRLDEVAEALVRSSKLIQMVLRMAPDTKRQLADAIGQTFLALPPDEREAAELCVDTVVAIRAGTDRPD